MTYTYKVSTQHDDSARFIVPVTVEAGSPEVAARERFNLLNSEARFSTRALLVTRIDEAWVFPVVSSRPTVGDALSVGGK